MTATARHQLGQLFIVQLRRNVWSSGLERFLRHNSPAGVLIAEPLSDSPAATHDFLARVVRSVSPPPLLALRQEGGRHDPLSAFLQPMPSLVSVENDSAAEQLAELFSDALALLGFNLNFAPRLDLNPENAGRKTISKRDLEGVAARGRAMIRALKRRKLLACAKHFPGRGSATANSSHGLAVSSKPMADLWREDLSPFRALLDDLRMVLISTAGYKAYDFDRPQPASQSQAVVAGLLRAKLGFSGVATAYDLAPPFDPLAAGDAAVKCMEAGCDLMIVHQDGEFEASRAAIEKALLAGVIKSESIARPLARIRAITKHMAPFRGRFPAKEFRRLEVRYSSFASEGEVRHDA